MALIFHACNHTKNCATPVFYRVFLSPYGIIQGMPMTPDQLPDNINALKALVAEQAAHNQQLLAQKQAGERDDGDRTGKCAAEC